MRECHAKKQQRKQQKKERVGGGSSFFSFSHGLGLKITILNAQLLFISEEGTTTRTYMSAATSNRIIPSERSEICLHGLEMFSNVLT